MSEKVAFIFASSSEIADHMNKLGLFIDTNELSTTYSLNNEIFKELNTVKRPLYIEGIDFVFSNLKRKYYEHTFVTCPEKAKNLFNTLDILKTLIVQPLEKKNIENTQNIEVEVVDHQVEFRTLISNYKLYEKILEDNIILRKRISENLKLMKQINETNRDLINLF